MSEPSFTHSIRATFPFFFVSNAASFFIYSLNRFVLEKVLTRCWFSSIRYSFRSLYKQIYHLNACKLELEELSWFLYRINSFQHQNIYNRHFDLIINDSRLLKVRSEIWWQSLRSYLPWKWNSIKTTNPMCRYLFKVKNEDTRKISTNIAVASILLSLNNFPHSILCEFAVWRIVSYFYFHIRYCF